MLVPNTDSETILYKIKKWYLLEANKILKQRLEYFADIMQIDYSGVSICNSKTRWGSCDNYKNIKLNFRLLMLPHKAIDFVLIHELAHILEFNHSKNSIARIINFDLVGSCCFKCWRCNSDSMIE